MFTGLIEQVGIVAAITSVGEARRLVIEVGDAEFLRAAQLGESISVSGVCLTVVAHTERTFEVEAVEETMRLTTLGLQGVGAWVNLERAMLMTARLGGHIVQGHVDGIATVSGVRSEGEGWWVTFEPPFALMRYIAHKGSICLDGISLTVANVAYNRFSVALIPHTREVTTAGAWEPGTQVNLETDVIAKYVERLTRWSAAAPPLTRVA